MSEMLLLHHLETFRQTFSFTNAVADNYEQILTFIYLYFQVVFS